MKGRKPDPTPQAAKGNPGRGRKTSSSAKPAKRTRKSAAVKAREEAAQLAELLGEAFKTGGSSEPPALIEANPTALKMWQSLAPVLAKTLRLQSQHRPLFVAFCIYYAEWALANEAVEREGRTKNVKTVSGSYWPRIHPMVKVRDEALKHALELSKRFGLTPSDEYSLFRDQAVAAAQNPGLFDDRPKPREDDQDEGAPTPDSGVIGAMGRLDSPPPERLN